MTRSEAVAAACLIGAIVALPFAARAHTAPSGWTYDRFCCDGRDCGQIPDDAVRITPQGFAVTLDPGDHPMITQHREYLIPFDASVRDIDVIRKSQDEHWHICFFPTEETVRCFFTAPMGY